jgi:probable phosphoglycerate mutase
LGERQALQTAQRLATEGITRVLSSPLLRALATASNIAEAAGNLPVEVWPEMREGYGDMPGVPVPIHRGPGRSELLRRFPRALLPADITEDGWDHGGDHQYEAFFARCAQVARLLEAGFGPGDRVVVVGHGGCLNYLLHALLGIAPTSPTWFQMAPCAISTLRLVPESERRQGFPLYPPVKVEVLSLNDISHLREEQRPVLDSTGERPGKRR